MDDIKKSSFVFKIISFFMILSLLFLLSACGQNDKEIKKRLQALPQNEVESEEKINSSVENNESSADKESVSPANPSDNKGLSAEARVIEHFFDEDGFRRAQEMLDELKEEQLQRDKKQEIVDMLEESVIEYGPKVEKILTIDLDQDTIEELVMSYLDLYKAYIETQHELQVEIMGESLGNITWDIDKKRLENLETVKSDLFEAKQRGDTSAFNDAKEEFLSDTYHYTVAILEAVERRKNENP